jgi:signal transduction histidine kinase
VIGAASIIQNTTQRKLNEERQYRAQKMETLGNLTSGIAHDFNNMLGVVLGYADIQLVSITHDTDARATEVTG